MNWETAISRFKIGKMYQDVSFDQIVRRNTTLAGIGKQWIETKEKPSLYLNGNTGSGKTYFSIALLKALIDQGKYPWIIFKRSNDLDDELLRAIEDRNEAFVLEKYHEVPILFWDDLGVERVSDRIIKQYYSIIDIRISNYLPTVFTSNIPLNKISDHLGERIASRLAMAIDVRFPENDLRKEI